MGGWKHIVPKFLREVSPDRAYVQMGLRDAKHFTAEDIEQITARYPRHVRAARIDGSPMLGSGAIYDGITREIVEENFRLSGVKPYIICSGASIRV